MSSASEAVFRIRGLEKRYGALRVLEDISLDLDPGEVVALIGPSGSGKSTLLRCLNLLEQPNGGEIVFRGEPIDYGRLSGRVFGSARLSRLRSRVGMVFQHFNLWPHMTVLGNIIEGPMRVGGVDRAHAIDRAEHLLERVDLVDKRDQYPARLSGGQQQRVAIVRALAMQPEVMLFDEVTSALDPELVGDVLALMASLAREGMTMLVATHEIGFAREVSHRTLFLDDGRIVEQGPSSEVLVRPEQARTQRFLQRILHPEIAAEALS